MLTNPSVGFILRNIIKTKDDKMTTTTKKYGYKIKFNGSATFFVIDENDDCILATNTERKAKNFLNRVLKSAGLV